MNDFELKEWNGYETMAVFSRAGSFTFVQRMHRAAVLQT
jgi:hypothetical protein